MRRFLMFISYLGTNYRGLAKQNGCGIKTIVGSLEEALAFVQPLNSVKVVPSSRTDKGVHALCSTVHVDLQPRKEGHEFDPGLLTFTANQMLHRSKESIRVLHTVRVPDDFHCRHNAIARTYLYRIQISKKPDAPSFGLPYSPLEINRIHTVSGGIDMDLVKAAADRLSGEHDFSAFTTLQALRDKYFQQYARDKLPREYDSRTEQALEREFKQRFKEMIREGLPQQLKTMKVTVEPGTIALQDHMDLYNEHYNVWNLQYTAKSFLYHQVRHMTGVLLAIGRGLIAPDILTEMLENPMKCHQNNEAVLESNLYTISPDGLYLKKVHYDEKDLQIEEDENQDIKLFNPIRELQDTEYAYEFVVKHANFLRIHKALLDPNSDRVEVLKKLCKDGKTSRKLQKRYRGRR